MFPQISIFLSETKDLSLYCFRFPLNEILLERAHLSAFCFVATVRVKQKGKWWNTEKRLFERDLILLSFYYLIPIF